MSSYRFVTVMVVVMYLSGCGDKDNNPDASTIDAAAPVGTVSLSWTIKNVNDVLTCDDVGASTVRLTLTEENAPFGEAESFDCDASTGTTRGLTPGNYTVEISLRASGARQLGGETLIGDVVIAVGQNTDLGVIGFDVVPQGNVIFTIDSGEAGGNCVGGAAITAVNLEMRNKSGVCVPGTEFNVGAGGGAAAFVHTSNCSNKTSVCIEKEQEIKVFGAGGGPASLYIAGDIEGDESCYSSLSSFTIAGDNLDNDIGVQSMSSCLGDAGI